MSMTRPPLGEVGVASSWGATPWPIDPTEAAAELQWPMSVWTYGRMARTDPQVTAVLRSLGLPLRRDIWRLDPAGCADEVAAFVSDEIDLPLVGSDRQRSNRNGRVSWDELVRLVLTELTYGFSCLEPVFEVVAGRVRLVKLAFRPPETMSEVMVDEVGNFSGIVQYAPAHSAGGSKRVIPADRLLWYSLDHLGAAVTGQSMLRSSWAVWKLKGRALRVWAMTCERNGMGIPVIEAPAGASQGDMDSLDKLGAAARAGEFSHAVTPAGAKLTFQGVSGTLPDVGAFVHYCDGQMARSVLAQFLQLGSQPNGSRALASEQIDFFALALDSVANQIADVTTTQLIDRLVRFQFGEGVPGPVVISSEPDSDAALGGVELARMVQTGALTMDDPLQEWVRQRYRMPRPDPTTATEPPAAAGPGTGMPVAAVAGQSRVAHALRRSAQVRATVLAAVAGVPRPAKGTAARMALQSMPVNLSPVTAEVRRLRAAGYRAGAARVTRKLSAAAPAVDDAEVAADPQRRLAGLLADADTTAMGILSSATDRSGDAAAAVVDDADEDLDDEELDALMADEASSAWAPWAQAALIAGSEYARASRTGSGDEGRIQGATGFEWVPTGDNPCDECEGLAAGEYGPDAEEPDSHAGCACEWAPAIGS